MLTVLLVVINVASLAGIVVQVRKALGTEREIGRTQASIDALERALAKKEGV